jgi:hypothetical protein
MECDEIGKKGKVKICNPERGNHNLGSLLRNVLKERY